MTANVAHPAFGRDPRRSWSARRGALLQVVQRCAADVLCLQELSREQHRDLLAAMPGFAHHGQVPRVDLRDPLNSIYYRSERFATVAVGGYWLSETPHVVGSRSWDSAYPRTAAWARLIDRRSGGELRVITTHLDNVSAGARLHQAQLLAAETTAYPEAYPQILAGDLNCAADSDPLDVLRRRFDDCWAAAAAAAVRGGSELGATYHGFDGPDYAGTESVAARRIDWILARGCRVHAFDVMRDSAAGVYPSDHYFLWADLELAHGAGA